MPISDYLECQAYEALHPFGERGDYLRAGLSASMIANAHRDSTKKREPYTPVDFWLFYEKKHDAQSEADALHAKFLAFKAKYESIQAIKKPS